MADTPQTRIALEAVFGDLEALTGDLAPADWQVQSYCPDWTVHGVVAHLLAIEEMLTGWFPESAEADLPFYKVAEIMPALSALSGPDLAARTTEVLAARRAELAALTDDQMAQGSPTPVGPGTYSRFMDVRVFDYLGSPTRHGDAARPLDR